MKIEAKSAPTKITKHDVLDYINVFTAQHFMHPTVDDFVEKFKRPRKVMADFLSRYTRYGILEAFKEQGQKTRYGPGINWARVDGLGWEDFFRAGQCPYCRNKGVLGIRTNNIIMYRCKWCREEWSESRVWVDKSILSEIERQAEVTRRQWNSQRRGIVHEKDNDTKNR